MDVSSSDAETRGLNELLDIFGSTFELREIAAAFCKAGCNSEVAAEILSESKGCSSGLSATYSIGSTPVGGVMSKQLSGNISKSSDLDFPTLKPRKNSFSTGTVSSVIGKRYSKSTRVSNGSTQTSKPMKVNLSDFEMSGIDGNGGVKLDSQTRKDSINSSIEDFLFKMLGDGFQLGMDVIQDVLGSCGYDANKSIDKLIDLSASTLKRSDDILDRTEEKFAGDHVMENTVHSKRNGANVSREVLTTLFTAPEREVEQPRKPFLVRAVKKTRTYGKVVSEPLIDTTPTLVTDIGDLQVQTNMKIDLEEDSYQILRRNAKEHWVTMKEYYKDAVEAFSKGNLSRAEEFLQQGNFFNKKAREADEKSSQNIFECSIKEDHDDVLLDLHDCDAKEAIRLLKFHLINFKGIQNLKVILEADSEDITKGSRRRRVMKLLEQESVNWTEDGGIIKIQLC